MTTTWKNRPPLQSHFLSKPICTAKCRMSIQVPASRDASPTCPWALGSACNNALQKIYSICFSCFSFTGSTGDQHHARAVNNTPRVPTALNRLPENKRWSSTNVGAEIGPKAPRCHQMRDLQPSLLPIFLLQTIHRE